MIYFNFVICLNRSKSEFIVGFFFTIVTSLPNSGQSHVLLTNVYHEGDFDLHVW